MAKNIFVQRRFFTTARGDTLIAILIILGVTFMVPRYLGIAWLPRLAGQALAYAIIPYFVIHYTVDSTVKYNQILIYSLIYVVVFLLMVVIALNNAVS
ncbi:MAG TPA: hypothetical protein P5309_00690 [Syntrophomonadaceae bacterium]|nr:hypothetical protein [Syntrophomonadaceae bacterium]